MKTSADDGNVVPLINIVFWNQFMCFPGLLIKLINKLRLKLWTLRKVNKIFLCISRYSKILIIRTRLVEGSVTGIYSVGMHLNVSRFCEVFPSHKWFAQSSLTWELNVRSSQNDSSIIILYSVSCRCSIVYLQLCKSYLQVSFFHGFT